jgi:ParB family transcriptional regulator, chromosome partitioning protein
MSEALSTKSCFQIIAFSYLEGTGMVPGGELLQVDPDKITKNPDNPRLIFREDEMEELLNSIKHTAIRVPLSVYRSGSKYVLLDGERRWRCAKKLNLKLVPVIVQPKPSKIENLLMMFNIHNVRVDWDLMPTAFKLGELRDLLKAEGLPYSPKDLATVTGMSMPSVRRALDLLELPLQYQKELIEEAKKPKREQKIKPDLFIEIFKSRNAIEKHVPEVFSEDVSPEDYVEAMYVKYKHGVIANVVKFRDISRIARSENAGVARGVAIPILRSLISEPALSIDDAFERTVKAAYERRDLVARTDSLADAYESIRDLQLDDELRLSIARLHRLLGDLL